MDQNKNKMVNPLAMALIKFTAFAAVSGLSPKRMIKNLPIKTNNGAPGRCGIYNLKQLEINSPQSQKLPVASMVMTYTVQAMAQTTHPTILFVLL